MSSGWDVYYVVFLSALVALVFPVTLGLVSALLTRRSKAPGPPPVVAHEELEPTRRFNTRFFLAVNVSSVLLVLSLALIPCAAALKPLLDAGDKDLVILDLIAITSISLFLSLALFYSARKGDLSWLRSFRPEIDQQKSHRRNLKQVNDAL